MSTTTPMATGPGSFAQLVLVLSRADLRRAPALTRFLEWVGALGPSSRGTLGVMFEGVADLALHQEVERAQETFQALLTGAFTGFTVTARAHESLGGEAVVAFFEVVSARVLASTVAAPPDEDQDDWRPSSMPGKPLSPGTDRFLARLRSVEHDPC